MEYYTGQQPIITQTPAQSIIPWKYIIFTIVISIVVGLIAYFIIKGKSTIPLAEGFANEQETDDTKELNTIMRKMEGLRSDLTSPAGVVTVALPFTSAHDREPVAETTARCFAKTIPARDLDITFETWRNRAQKLFKRAKTMEQPFMTLWADVYAVAKEKCLAGTPSIAGQPLGPRDAAPFDPLTGNPLSSY